MLFKKNGLDSRLNAYDDTSVLVELVIQKIE